MSNKRKLRFYQEDINSKVKKFLLSPARRGQVYSPTGSGKTVCFQATIYDLPKIVRCASKLKRKLNICIVHPRIALSQDQLKRFKADFGKQFHYTSFHSGKHIAGDEPIAEINTTEPEELLEVIKNSDRTHITFSSYASFNKIAHMEFDLLICDEAHYLVQPGFENALHNIAAKKTIFYTATPITDKMEDVKSVFCNSQGMTNPDLFGDIICAVEPKKLIERGYIVPPMIHFLRVDTNKRGNGVDTTEIVASAFLYQSKETKKNGLPFCKMLIASRGYSDHKKVENELNKLWETIGCKVDVYVIEAGSSRCNGRELPSRYKALEDVNNSRQDAIVLHYDTLSEGIDIDTLTGVCILRQLSKAKLMQTIGRCGRPYKEDLNRDGEVINMKHRRKKYSVVTLPIVDGNHIGGLDSQTISDAFIDCGYDDIMTYMALQRDDEKKPATTEDLLSLGESDVDDMYSSIQRIERTRYYDKLIQMGLLEAL